MSALRPMFYMRIADLDDAVNEDPQWLAHYIKNIKCPACERYNIDWQTNPYPINVVLTRAPRMCYDMAWKSWVFCVRKDLYDVLKPHLAGMLIGAVAVAGTSSTPQTTDFVSLVVPPSMQIRVHRGAGGLQSQCPACGTISSRWGSHEGIAARYLDHRHLYGNENNQFYVDDVIRRALKADRRFKDLRFNRHKVIPEPLDGDVLPGDPGWDGTFRPQLERLKGRV